MTRVIVYDRCIDVARATCVRLRKAGLSPVAVHPTDFDRTFDAEGIPHLIVTELQMPMFSGFELVRQVRLDWARGELPIVAYTSIDDALAWNKARDIGVNEVVAKSGPDPLSRLEAAVARCLGRTTPPPSAPLARPFAIFSRIFHRPAMAAAA